MATVITHGIAAGALAFCGPAGVSRLRLAVVLAVLAALPDIDVIGFRFGVAYGEPLGHRGFTHSILFALLIGCLMPTIAFPRVPRFGRAWRVLATLGFLASLSHGVLDAFTDAGLGVGFLIPFDNERYFAPWRPLATSPLSVSRFLQGGDAARILLNELLWVGVPVGLALTAGWLFRRLRRG